MASTTAQPNRSSIDDPSVASLCQSLKAFFARFAEIPDFSDHHDSGLQPRRAPVSLALKSPI